MKKLFLLMSTALVLTACGTETEAPSQESAPVEETTGQEVTATLDIVIDGESVADLTEEVTVPEGSYLLDVMQDTYDLEEEGGFISAIEGYEEDLEAERYWLSYKDGEMLPVGAAEYELEEDDHIEWRLEDSE